MRYYSTMRWCWVTYFVAALLLQGLNPIGWLFGFGCCLHWATRIPYRRPIEHPPQAYPGSVHQMTQDDYLDLDLSPASLIDSEAQTARYQ